MTEWTNWFQQQLKASGDSLIWAIERLDTSLHLELPPDAEYFGSWHPVRHIWHITLYEQLVAVPSMMQWLGDPAIPEIEWDDGDSRWETVEDKSAASLTAVFQEVRQQQIELLPQFKPEDWARTLDTVWEVQPLSMVVTKTFQHTYEHADPLLRMGLWWKPDA